MGNICRRPTADGLFRNKVKRYGLEDAVPVDSAGTHNFHPGNPPGVRSQDHAARRGYDLSTLGARQIQASDFDQFDLILAMDWDNLALVRELCPSRHQKKVRRMIGFCMLHTSSIVLGPLLR
jgi:protein-tyrosine phosphatase